jgi:hypothetical protein
MSSHDVMTWVVVHWKEGVRLSVAASVMASSGGKHILPIPLAAHLIFMTVRCRQVLAYHSSPTVFKTMSHIDCLWSVFPKVCNQAIDLHIYWYIVIIESCKQ